MTLPAEHFVDTVHANVDNSKLSDAEFRDFIRNTIPLYKVIISEDRRETER